MNSRSILADPVGIVVLVFVLVGTGLLVFGASWLGVTYRRTRGFLLGGAVVVGAWFAQVVLRTSSGYLAGLLYGQVLFLMTLPLLASVVITVVPKSRRFGWAGLIGSGLMVAGFFITYFGGYYLGVAAWVTDGPVPIR